MFVFSVCLLCFLAIYIHAVFLSWFCAFRVAVCCVCCVSCMNSSLSFHLRLNTLLKSLSVMQLGLALDAEVLGVSIGSAFLPLLAANHLTIIHYCYYYILKK